MVDSDAFAAGTTTAAPNVTVAALLSAFAAFFVIE
jgi:hypothetical protein